MSKPKSTTAPAATAESQPESAAAAREWFPIHEMPTEDAEAQFLVRASARGRPLLARLRKTRGYDDRAMRYVHKLVLVDAATGLKLSFKPIEFSPAPAIETEPAE